MGLQLSGYEKGKFSIVLLLLLGNISFGLYIHLYSEKPRHVCTGLYKKCEMSVFEMKEVGGLSNLENSSWSRGGGK